MMSRDCLYLSLDLRHAAEKVAVILGDGTDARKAGEFARLLVAVDLRRLKIALTGISR